MPTITITATPKQLAQLQRAVAQETERLRQQRDAYYDKGLRLCAISLNNEVHEQECLLAQLYPARIPAGISYNDD